MIQKASSLLVVVVVREYVLVRLQYENTHLYFQLVGCACLHKSAQALIKPCHPYA